MNHFIVLRLLALVSVLGLVSCLPIPQIRLDPEVEAVSYRVSPLTIRTDYVMLPGFQEPETPNLYNKALYLRYFVANDTADTVLVLMPGIFGGATSFDIIARQLVASTPGLEVWAVDRRANLLEDRSAIRASLSSRNPMIAYNHYVRDINTSEGFIPKDPNTFYFMGEWGLETHLRDLHEIVKVANVHAERVILGGHSFGASMVSYYAAYDFGDNEPDIGDQHIDGLLLIDGVLGRTGGFDREDKGLNLGPLELIPGAEGLAEGDSSPFLTFGLDAEFFARRETAAMLARYAPEELSPGGYFDYPVTNRAALAIREDDQYGPSTVFSSSLGSVVGADVSGNLTAVLIGGRQGVYSQTVIGVAKGHEFVSWSGEDVIEISDLNEVVRAWALPETNRSEWYFPIRLALDVGKFNVRLEGAEGFVPNREVTTPTLAVGAERGLVQDLESFSAYSNTRLGSAFSSYILPDLTHLDIIQAKDSALVALFKLWLNQLT